MSQVIVYTAGVWDLLHEGHIHALREAKKLGDKLIVGVVSDEGADAYKRVPVKDENARLALIRAIRYVDFALIQESTDPTRELEVIRPHIFTHGADWNKLLKGHDTLGRLGIKFVQTSLVLDKEVTSSTELLENIVNGYSAGQ